MQAVPTLCSTSSGSKTALGFAGRAVVCLLLLCLAYSAPVAAQTELLQGDWQFYESEHFTAASREPSRRVHSALQSLEQWRVAVAALLQTEGLPRAAVPNLVYLFDSDQQLTDFSYAQESAFFSATPRNNFLAFLVNDDESASLLRHHYAHFLIRNNLDLRLPRWYEEGLAAFLSRIQSGRNRFQFDQYTSRNNEAMVRVSEAFSMERLLFRDQALASPRNLQIANLKSESLYYYLTHGYLLDDFPDRREALREYLGYLQDGRNPRFAYDRAFDVTPEQLDEELHRFLAQSSRPRVTIESPLPEVLPASARSLAGNETSMLLGELALNGGRAQTAQSFFEVGIASSNALARSYSGLGDALRFQDLEGADQVSDQEIARYFQTALDLAPNDVNIVLDFGEYWEAELVNCDKQYTAAERQQYLSDIEQSFNYALQLAPDNPEVHLALGQLALLPERDWQQGQSSQRRAFDLLPADGFIMEQAARYAIEEEDFERADRLIAELAQAIHSFGEPGFVTDLRERLLRKRRNEPYDSCASE